MYIPMDNIIKINPQTIYSIFTNRFSLTNLDTAKPKLNNLGCSQFQFLQPAKHPFYTLPSAQKHNMHQHQHYSLKKSGRSSLITTSKKITIIFYRIIVNAKFWPCSKCVLRKLKAEIFVIKFKGFALTGNFPRHQTIADKTNKQENSREAKKEKKIKIFIISILERSIPQN